MADETIEVRYKPLFSGIGGFGDYYHKYLVYTDSSGNKTYLRGGPSNTPGGYVGDISSTATQSDWTSSVLNGGPFGKIVVDYGTYDTDSIDYGVGHASETIATGLDLSTQWSSVFGQMVGMNNDYTYIPTSQNSNTIIDEALTRSGLPQPTQDGFGDNWSPGSEGFGDGVPEAPPSDAPRPPGGEGPGGEKFGPPLPNQSGGNGDGGTGGGDDDGFLGDVPDTISPLVLDLDGDGVELTALDGDTTAMFDMDGDGFRERVGWVGSDDGLLAIDLNSDGVINDITELFGSEHTNGFAYLAAYDDVQDGIIDNKDSDWSNLLIWRDDNSDGVSQNTELHTLSSLNITAISLNSVSEVNYDLAGNPISHEGTFTINGNTRDIVDAWFKIDQLNSIRTTPLEFDYRVLFLPTQRGYGNLDDLHVAMSSDEDLLEMVQAIAERSFTEFFTDHQNINDELDEILYKWAGVDSLSPTSRGDNIDARKLAFIEKFADEKFIQLGHYENPFQRASDALNDIWDFVSGQIKGNILMQAGANTLFADKLHYDFLIDGFSGGGYALDSTSLGDLEDEINLLSSGDRLAAWTAFADFIYSIVGFDDTTDNLDSGDQALLDSIISASLSDVLKDWDYVKEQTFTQLSGNNVVGTSGNDNINPSSLDPTSNGDDFVQGFNGHDTIDGGLGNDELWGMAGNDVLTGGAGGDILDGGSGDDDYYVDGDDVLSEVGGSGYDEIFMPTGIVLADLTFSRSNTYDLYVEIDGNGTILLDNHFQSTYNFERINFSNSTYFDLSTFTALPTYGDKGNNTLAGYTGVANFVDYLYGLDGDDNLSASTGNDFLDGGLGNDDLEGGAGDDTYIASQGYDTIHDTDFNSGTNDGFDVIEFEAGITYSSLQVYKSGTYSLKIDWGIGNSITITNFFNGTGQRIEQLNFADSSTYNLTSGVIGIRGSHGNDSLSGLSISGYSEDDQMWGLGGNDTLNGGNGNDTIYGGEGSDTIQGQNNNDTLFGEAGNDTLTGNSGNDMLFGGAGNDQLKGSSGDDLFFYDSGMDTILQDSISDRGGTDTLQFGLGISIYSLTFQDYALDADHAQIILNAGVNEVLIEEQNGSNANYKTEYLKFDDLEIAFTNYDNWIWGTTGNNTLNGDASGSFADTILANAGDDTVHGYNANDQIDGGAGNDAIYGDAGDDLLYGGSGNDIIYGGSGVDTIIGGAGDDTVVFELASAFSNIDTIKDFNVSDDVINLVSLLTSYNPLTDLITDYVQITESSGNSLLSVDRDGLGGTYTLSQIATLSGVTGITDEQALVNNGNLIVS